jgi:hypothetical protein
VKSEVGLDGVLGCGGDERIHRRLDRGAARRVAPRGRERRRLGLDPEPEVDHVEHVLVGADRGGFHGERCRLRNGENE